jgi:hypothetical protein
MFKNLDGLGVLALSAHLLVTLAIMVLYGITALSGHADETLKYILFAAAGYWFGAVKLPSPKEKPPADKGGVTK